VSGVRPSPVEDELAVAVRLQVERHGADQPVAVAREHETRHAARAGADAARRLQSSQEGVLEKRIAVARQPIPSGGVDVRDALDDLDFDA
jgi:hypothetical protein